MPAKLGSMENWLNRFSAKLAERHSVSVATYGPCHPEVRAQLEAFGISWHNLEEIEGSFISAREWLRQHADAAHFSLFAPRSKVVVAAALLHDVKVVFQDCHSSSAVLQRQSLVSRMLDRVTFSRTARVVAVSQFVARRIESRFGVRDHRLQVVYNGVDVERFKVRSLPSTGRYTACVASLIPAKGVDVLIRAFSHSSLASETLVICGEGAQRSELEAIALNVGVADRVKFVGQRDDVQHLVGDAALLVHPAIWGEAFGLTIAEAMAAGRPVVGSRVGAVPELIEDGLTGLIVPPNDPHALADAIASLLRNPQRRDVMGAAARKRVIDRFSMSDWVKTHSEIVDEILGTT